jgi:chromosome segregation ATPase
MTEAEKLQQKNRDERLRDKVTQLENDLILQSAELEDATSKISQRDEEIARLTNDRPYNSDFEESPADLIRQVQILREENAELEKRLLAEKRSREAYDEEMRQQMGEEQRALIEEGENLMASLRKDLRECEAKLSQAESEAYTARQQVEELGDERKGLEQRDNEMKKQILSYDDMIARQLSQSPSFKMS